MNAKANVIMGKWRFILYYVVLITVFLACQEITVYGSDKTDKEIVVEGNNVFVFDLYAQLKEEDGNLFFSPYSISTALAMTYAGARGNTATQMADVLHFDLPQDRLPLLFSELIQDLYTTPEESGYQLNIANALWGQQGELFLKEFLSLIKQSYRGGFYEVDFAKKGENARQTINKWVEEKTQDKIKELILPPDLTPLTMLVLTNAIYFKGYWSSQFKKENTKDTPFKLITGEEVDTPIMYQKAEFNYAEDDITQILEMSYIGNKLSMIILLPKKENGLKQLEGRFTIENFRSWISMLREQEVNVWVPKFKVTSRFYLEEILKEMGMSDAFSCPPADFSGMIRRKDLFISHVIHKAFVDVNEEGTEAAAATAVVVMKGISMPKTFKADHPFIFMIRDNRSGSILFLGRVMDPRS